MAKSVTFSVKDSPERKTYPERNRLKKNGFQWNAKENAWQIKIPKSEVNSYLHRYGQQMRFSVSTDEPEYSKQSSQSYRKAFLNAYSHSQPYHCVYCGRRLSLQSSGNRQLTIDHIVSERSVNGSPNSLENRKRAAKQWKITNINQIDNLVPACASCNQKKGGDSKLIEIGRGILGRNMLRHREKQQRKKKTTKNQKTKGSKTTR